MLAATNNLTAFEFYVRTYSGFKEFGSVVFTEFKTISSCESEK